MNNIISKLTIQLIFLATCTFCFGQIGYLGKRVSVSTNANAGTLLALHNELNLNIIVAKKIEFFGNFGTSFNSSFYTTDSRENISLNNISAKTNNSLFGGFKTTEKLTISTIGGGMRFYFRTKLAPVGHYFETSFNHINATVKGFDKYAQETYTYSGDIYNPIVGTATENVSSVSLNEIIIGFHRKRVYKGGWFLSTGFKLVAYSFGDNGDNKMENDTFQTLQKNKFYFCLTFGKFLF